MNRHARGAAALVPPPSPTLDPSLVRINMTPLAHQAVCASCFRHSPIIEGDEACARARVQELGWTVANPGGVLSCPICMKRAAPPVLERPSRQRVRRVSGTVEAAAPPAAEPAPAPATLSDTLCDSLPAR